MFLIWPFVDPAAAEQFAPRVGYVLAGAGFPRVVYPSAASAEDDPDSCWAASIRAERVVRWPYGAAARSLVHEDDIATVAV